MFKVSDRVRDVTLDSGVVDGQPAIQEPEKQQGDPVEGFVCPSCYSEFTSPELLQVAKKTLLVGLTQFLIQQQFSLLLEILFQGKCRVSTRIYASL